MKNSLLAIALALIAAAAAAGCAGSTASRAARDQSRVLSLSDLNSASQRLVTNIVASKSFGRFKDKQGYGENKEVAVQLIRIIDRTGGSDGDNNIAYQEQLFDQLEERFAENDVRLRYDRVVLGSGGEDSDAEALRNDERVRAMKQVKGQDADDDIDQSTGTTLTGATAKATLAMEVTVFAQTGANGAREWELRAKLYEAGKKALLVSASSQPKSTDN
jgi:hypothetical protein